MSLKDKKVVVTGACGFIGSHLVQKLVDEGAKVKAFVYYNSFNNWGWIESLGKKYISQIEIITGDIRDISLVQNTINNSDIVFHLAALIAIPYSYISPESYLETNIKGTLNVLQSCKKNKNIEKIIITSTSEVYGTAKYTPIDENHPKQGQSPYSATKIAADYLSESFFRSFNLPISIVRPFNTFGPRQSARAIIPTIITQLLMGQNEIKLGNLLSTRDLLFVNDTVNGFVEICKSNKTIGKEINIATQTEISMEELANKIITIINPNAKIIQDEQRLRPINSEVNRLIGSNKLILELTEWKQKYSLEEGLIKTIDWFNDNNNLGKYKNIYNI